MTSKKIRELFLDFFKQRGHAIVPSSSLISDDPSVLFTTAGMQQFKPYYLGEKSPYGKNVVSIQKCFRTSDIDAVGDESHLTFFEMLGNFSFGGYFKEKAIEYAYEFLAKKLKLKIGYVSVFDGDKENNIPPDEESEKIWEKIDGDIEIRKAGKKDNFWGPTGEEGPCGPTTEIYINGVEIWNIVFNEYCKDKEGKFTKLKTPGVDTGMGLERLAMAAQNKPTIFETDLFTDMAVDELGQPLIPDELPFRAKRVTLDHARGIAFLIADGVFPSNKDAGYVLRRLMRRIITYEQIANNPSFDVKKIFHRVTQKYGEFYPDLDFADTSRLFDEEDVKFTAALKQGLKEMDKAEFIDADIAFDFYQSYGLPYEIIKELGKEKAKKLTREDFDEKFKKHQEISRAGLDKKFGGHGLKEDGEITDASDDEKQKLIRLHTATHLLHQALADLFGNEIKQMGSDINPERLRFDFPFGRKLTAGEIVELETIVNQKIKENLPIRFEEKSKEEAVSEGAKAFFRAKYPDRVKVYSIGHSTDSGQAYSKEICNGPHVRNTAEIGRFKIIKEEAVSAGVRRIKAVVEEKPDELS